MSLRSPLHLEIPSQEVLIGGETFVLRELSARDLAHYIQLQADAVEASREADPSQSLDEMVSRVIEQDNSIIRWLLKRDDSWIEANMVPSTKRKLLEIQNELNGLDKLAGENSEGNGATPASATA